MEHGFWHYLLMPTLIATARILDVSIGTLRIIYVSKGIKNLSALLGFFEVLIWINAIALIMKNLDNWANYIGYALGFAIGNYIGIAIEERISMGNCITRVISHCDPGPFIENLKRAGHEVTQILSESYGAGRNFKDRGESFVLLVAIPRKELKWMIDQIKAFDPSAFISIEDIRMVSDPYLQTASWKSPFILFDGARNFCLRQIMNVMRKGK